MGSCQHPVCVTAGEPAQAPCSGPAGPAGPAGCMRTWERYMERSQELYVLNVRASATKASQKVPLHAAQCCRAQCAVQAASQAETGLRDPLLVLCNAGWGNRGLQRREPSRGSSVLALLRLRLGRAACPQPPSRPARCRRKLARVWAHGQSSPYSGAVVHMRQLHLSLDGRGWAPTCV